MTPEQLSIFQLDLIWYEEANEVTQEQWDKLWAQS